MSNQPNPAAFRRLGVETTAGVKCAPPSDPAAFRRLCVETDTLLLVQKAIEPAAFRRLCVETPNGVIRCWNMRASRLQAAVC